METNSTRSKITKEEFFELIKMFDYILQTNFDSDGQDIIYWYLTEKKKYPDLEMFDDKHNIIPTKSIRNLWNVVKNYMI